MRSLCPLLVLPCSTKSDALLSAGNRLSVRFPYCQVWRFLSPESQPNSLFRTATIPFPLLPPPTAVAFCVSGTMPGVAGFIFFPSGCQSSAVLLSFKWLLLRRETAVIGGHATCHFSGRTSASRKQYKTFLVTVYLKRTVQYVNHASKTLFNLQVKSTKTSY